MVNAILKTKEDIQNYMIGPVPTGHECEPGARADASIGSVPTVHECEPGARANASIGPVPTGHECEPGAGTRVTSRLGVQKHQRDGTASGGPGGSSCR